MIRSFNGKYPAIAPSVFISETAVIIGDVEIGSDSSVWYNVVIRGDVNSIKIGRRTNIQDQSVLHVTGARGDNYPGYSLSIKDEVTIGHNVTLHGCTVENRAFIGMNAMIMDRAVIGEGAMIAAGSLVTEGMIIPPWTLWIGSPAKFIRVLSPQEKIRSIELSESYVNLSRKYIDQNIPLLSGDFP